MIVLFKKNLSDHNLSSYIRKKKERYNDKISNVLSNLQD